MSIFLGHWKLRLSIIGLFVGMFCAYASDLSLTSVYVKKLTKDRIAISVNANIQMSQEQTEALENGIPFLFVYDINLKEEGRWAFLQPDVASERYRFQLTYHGLSKQYVVRNLNLAKQESHPTLSLALSSIAEPVNMKILLKKALARKRYIGGIRLRLDIEALPTPLRLPAYLSKNWRLNTGWNYWEIN